MDSLEDQSCFYVSGCFIYLEIRGIIVDSVDFYSRILPNTIKRLLYRLRINIYLQFLDVLDDMRT